MAAFSELEIKQTRERGMIGKAVAAQQGHWPTNSVPYRYRREQRRLVLLRACPVEDRTDQVHGPGRQSGTNDRTRPVQHRRKAEHSRQPVALAGGAVDRAEADDALPRLELDDVRDQLAISQDQGEYAEADRAQAASGEPQVDDAGDPSDPAAAEQPGDVAGETESNAAPGPQRLIRLTQRVVGIV